ncbi:FIST signal transduction protein [endosymbiont of Ridgeia piscesae]|jgi:hypothetical protein|uniref:FIST N domain protein n=1 Tax=endosymbiont of Ridgeia piscesae TaxID=54398 RepID=A0A0T5Z684_9GAMM|nr:FIST N-terminal domain-containing protein [endosymbiont of Ridgeia piscesae]KRT56545.1 hypothetical protein Ga0074115_1541 [endosymbiont of Ridgeia piscesae]KRT58344.1 hypothetical protein Ga0076813_13343 [endosymbiont of Ridgeia piscesae]
MQLSTYQYSPDRGWDKPLDPTLDSDQTWLILFGTSDIDALASGMDNLRTAFPQAIWIGCSTAGEILGPTLSDHTLSVAVLRFAHTKLRCAVREIDDTHASFEAGTHLTQSLAAPDLKGVFVLSDGLKVNGSELVKGLSESLPEKVIITGGLAGDGDSFQKTWVVVDKHPRSHHIVAVGLYGEHVGIAHGSRGGWDVLGVEREVTRAEGNVLYSLDGQPALTLYKRFLGERAAGLPATGLLFLLAIRNDLEEDGWTVRTILSVDETKNAITFAGDIPQGSYVRLMRANFERLIDGAADAADSVTLQDYPGGPLLSVAISCVGRRLVLGQRTEEEIEASLDGLPQGTEQIGFYSYGEISPLASGRCDLHNQTMTLSLFWEK